MAAHTPDWLAKEITDTRLSHDSDCVTAVCGHERRGKSVLAYQLSKCIAKHIGTPFEIDKNVFFDPMKKTLIEDVRSLPDRSAVHIDESYKAFNKLETFNKFARKLNEMFTKIGYKNHAYFLCMPFFRDFKKYFREHRISIWVQVIQRGYAVVYEKDENMFTEDPWRLTDNFFKVVELSGGKNFGSFPIEQKIDIYSQCAGYIGHITYGDLEGEEKAQYTARMKEAKSKSELEEDDRQEDGRPSVIRDKFKAGLRKLRSEYEMSESEIAEMFNISPSAVSNYTRGEKHAKK